MSRFEVVHSDGGFALLLDDECIAGLKLCEYGEVYHSWETEETFAKVDKSSRWFELFGTPEKAARTIIKTCYETTECEACPIFHADINALNINCSDYDELLEWLGGDAE
jgi:hypothetical protein